ncbi:MAG: hypothetical protein HY241_07335 [Actinobacteria bacterium]|nr:hypothetical protein [Actinomycetota bacterium]
MRAFESPVTFVRRLQSVGIVTGVFSASRNCRSVLDADPARCIGVDRTGHPDQLRRRGGRARPAGLPVPGRRGQWPRPG